MIYYLRNPDTDRISIRYYRTADIYEAKGAADSLEIVRIDRGSKDALTEACERFSTCRGISSTYYNVGALRAYLAWPPTPRRISARDIARKYSIRILAVVAILRHRNVKEIMPSDAAWVYEEYRKAVRATAATA